MLYPVFYTFGLPTLSYRASGDGCPTIPSHQAIDRTQQTALWEVLMRPA